MASAAVEVFRAQVPSVGLTLKVRSVIDGKQAEYQKRIAEDVPDKAYSDGCVDYKANVDWLASFGDESAAEKYEANQICRKAPVFFETKYFFRGDFKDSPKPIKDVQINHRLASVGDAFNFDEGVLVGSLDFINEPGRFRLDLKVIFTDGTWTNIAFEFYVVSVKMNILRDYDKILTTIESKRPKLAQAFLGKSFWGASLQGENLSDDKTWYQILSEVYEYYVKAVKRIVNNPHLRYVSVEEYRRADRIKHWTPALATRFNRLGKSERAHALFRTERVEGAIDTPENRFVLYTLKELSKRLGNFAAEQAKVSGVNPNWVEGVKDMASELKKLSNNPFFLGVSRFEGFRQQSLVMQKRAGYAQIFTVWLKLKQALTPGGNDVDISYRPISMLYEFWCFLKMREMLEGVFGAAVKDEVLSATEEDLLETPELIDGSAIDETKLSKLNVEFAKGETKVILTYQKTYGSKEREGEAFSSLNPQRPDIVLTIAAEGNEYSYLFDAKYRIWSVGNADATTRDAIDAMYRYRDAILYRLQKAGIKREIIGAYVLYPGRQAPHIYEPYQKAIDNEGIGAIPLLPGFYDVLEENINKILDRHTPAAHLALATSVRGTSTVVGEAMSEASIPTIKIDGNKWPRLSDDKAKSLDVTIEQARAINKLPMLVRLESNNKAMIIVKVVSEHCRSNFEVSYNIEWTPEG